MGSPGGGRGPSRERDRIRTLLVEARAGTGGGVKQQEQWKDPLPTQPDRESELSQTNGSVQEVCVGVVPLVQSKLLRVLHAHRGKKLLQDFQHLENTAMKRDVVRFRGAWEKGVMVFVECLGVLQEDTMEGPLWRETLGRSLGSHDVAKLVGGMCHGNGFRQETIRPYAISCTKAG